MADVEVHGTVASGFEGVRDAFARNFSDHAEQGAGFALHVGGELVVDIWGGVARPGDGTPWTEDTLQLVFSTTKGVAAICVGMLVDRGRLDLDEPVVTHWPEFGAAGKDGVTVGQMMSHRAGVPTIDGEMALDDALAVAPIVAALAAQAPLWEPDSNHGYHALTYGWLVGELVRRVDGRTLNRFLQEEVCEPLGVEFWMGLPESEEHRVAELQPSPPPATPEELELMMAVAGPGTLGGRALSLNGTFGQIGGTEMVWNTRAVHASEIPAAGGITNARSLSTIYAATIGEVNGVRLLSDDAVAAMSAERSNAPDQCLIAPTRFGAGFWLSNDLAPMGGPRSFGHPGAGGSLGYADPDSGVGYGYVMNQMGGGIAGDPRTIGLNTAIAAAL